MARLNASFVCTGEGEGLHKKFEFGRLCCGSRLEGSKDGWKGEEGTKGVDGRNGMED